MVRTIKILTMVLMLLLFQQQAHVVTAHVITSNSQPVSEGIEKTKDLKQGDYVTIFMGREARNITIDWGEGTDCEFDIQISCGHGSFNSVSVEKARGAGKQTYKFIRTTVEELRIVILKGHGTIKNMQTLSTKADDNSSYNPI